MGIESDWFDSGTVSPEEVLASDVSGARAQLETEIARLEGESAALLEGADTTDAPIDGTRAQQLAEKLASLRIQLAQLDPVTPPDEPEE
jgi:hypothetical protein